MLCSAYQVNIKRALGWLATQFVSFTLSYAKVWAVIIFIYWHKKLIPSLEKREKNDYFSVGLTNQSTTVLQWPFLVV